jgi:hypothetical protein
MEMRGFPHYTKDSYYRKAKEIVEYFGRPISQVTTKELVIITGIMLFIGVFSYGVLSFLIMIVIICIESLWEFVCNITHQREKRDFIISLFGIETGMLFNLLVNVLQWIYILPTLHIFVKLLDKL